ncbi:nitrile hydratase subunit beta [Mesorhizobium sp. B2-4-19]|uniref:nitrile hydratase subunit beta n=1 Tax=Mesorhizobium sp. B2-4-19 TaxID=2589930 RepID=UPI0015E344CD|nr:nitrile hydratase subunit beta [Mesorhizobium sp. B2-4-19]
MDGIHDLGGMHGFGPVPVDKDDYVFKHEWQRRSFGLTQALAGTTPYCADMHRFKIEKLLAIDYLQMDYFEKWAVATSELLKDAGLVSEAELSSGKKVFDVDLTRNTPATPEGLVEVMKSGAKLDFPPETSRPQFVVGETIRVSVNHASGHTRVPRYVRGKVGSIVADMGVFQFADTVAAGSGPHPQHCYTVEFTAGTLWGNGAERAGDRFYLDLAETYIDHL